MPRDRVLAKIILLLVLIVGLFSLGAQAATLEQAIDTNGNGIIDDAEIMAAVHYWITGQLVPTSGGQIIDDQEVLKLVALWTTDSPISGSRTLTLDDNGQTIQLHVGERFLLKLDSNDTKYYSDWTVTIADPTIVSLVPGVLVIQGAQGLYEARQEGQTMLTAMAQPIRAWGWRPVVPSGHCFLLSESVEYQTLLLDRFQRAGQDCQENSW